MAQARKATPEPKERAAAIAARQPPPVPAAVKQGVYVFLADDEPDVAFFNGEQFVLQSGTTEITSRWKEIPALTIAKHIVDKLGVWGVCITRGPVEKGRAALAEDQPAVDAAQARYLRQTHTWANEAIRASFEINKPYVEAGLTPKWSDEALTARTWLSKHEKDLRAAGLLE